MVLHLVNGITSFLGLHNCLFIFDIHSYRFIGLCPCMLILEVKFYHAKNPFDIDFVLFRFVLNIELNFFSTYQIIFFTSLYFPLNIFLTLNSLLLQCRSILVEIHVCVSPEAKKV